MKGLSAVRVAVTAVTAAVLLVTGAGTLRAQRLDTTLNVRGQARLNVSNMTGTVTIRSWTRSQIRVQAEYDRASVEIGEAGAGRFNVRTQSHRGSSEVDYTITVPHGTDIQVTAISSDVRVTDVCGGLSLNTTSGDVVVDCIEGEATIQTVSGDVSVANVKTRHLEVSSTSGDVTVRGVKGGVAAHAVSGDVILSQIDGDEVNAETVSGDIQYEGRVVDNGRYGFEAHSGDVTLHVNGTLNATISVSTFNGDFYSDYPITIQQGPHDPHEWEFKLGTGSARLRMQSFSGSINLRRGIAAPREE